ncbi:MAG: LytR C-terminal domain-containing protein [Bifidobacterium sp.]|nr:LytR C-terminal domain-containing protein [Bifidobacterium sp.]
MARSEENAVDPYAEDAFDTPPAGPVGVHRGKRSLARRLIPFLVVVIVAALAGLLVWGLYSGEAAKLRLPWRSDTVASQSAAAPSKTPAESPSASTSSASSSAPSTDASQSPEASSSSSTQEPPQQTVNKNAAVQVINGTRINRYAAGKAAILVRNGYTNVTASTPSGQVPSATVVWYQNETDLATAQDVAKTLGIANVRQAQQITSPVVVVLMS